MSKHCVNNPVSVNQLVDLNVQRCPEDFPDGECGGLNQYLQDLYDRVCSLENPNLDLKCFETNNFEDLMQGIVDQVCCFSCLGEVSSCDESSFKDLDFCRPGGWVCDVVNSGAGFCIEVSSCGSEPTNEEVIQALVSRVIDLSAQVHRFCSQLEALETQYAELREDLDNINCCD